IAASAAALSRIPSLLPPSLPLLTPPSLDVRTLTTAAAVSLLAAATLAAWPLLRMRDATAPAPRGVAPLARSRAFRALVVTQVALAVALVAAAALLQQSLDTVRSRRAGFAVDNVLVARLTMAGPVYRSTARLLAAQHDLSEALARLPGVRGVALAYDHPLQ